MHFCNCLFYYFYFRPYFFFWMDMSVCPVLIHLCIYPISQCIFLLPAFWCNCGCPLFSALDSVLLLLSVFRALLCSSCFHCTSACMSSVSVHFFVLFFWSTSQIPLFSVLFPFVPLSVHFPLCTLPWYNRPGSLGIKKKKKKNELLTCLSCFSGTSLCVLFLMHFSV